MLDGCQNLKVHELCRKIALISDSFSFESSTTRTDCKCSRLLIAYMVNHFRCPSSIYRSEARAMLEWLCSYSSYYDHEKISADYRQNTVLAQR